MVIWTQLDQSEISSPHIRIGCIGWLDGVSSCVLNRSIVDAFTAPEGPIVDRGDSFSRRAGQSAASVEAMSRRWRSAGVWSFGGSSVKTILSIYFYYHTFLSNKDIETNTIRGTSEGNITTYLAPIAYHHVIQQTFHQQPYRQHCL